eukprot:TRINITY_DN43272_c0_g1_i1.p1 TRINITY_DN43272_c0_g1~~TRINITY_DN43272_c0_g1_i1.p1  ORF type:complete len:931 (+),score=301.62 TRINITY_DN43272_c0_g1_i1:117-2909(+)
MGRPDKRRSGSGKEKVGGKEGKDGKGHDKDEREVIDLDQCYLCGDSATRQPSTSIECNEGCSYTVHDRCDRRELEKLTKSISTRKRRMEIFSAHGHKWCWICSRGKNPVFADCFTAGCRKEYVPGSAQPQAAQEEEEPEEDDGGADDGTSGGGPSLVGDSDAASMAGTEGSLRDVPRPQLAPSDRVVAAAAALAAALEKNVEPYFCTKAQARQRASGLRDVWTDSLSARECANLLNRAVAADPRAMLRRLGRPASADLPTGTFFIPADAEAVAAAGVKRGTEAIKLSKRAMNYLRSTAPPEEEAAQESQRPNAAPAAVPVVVQASRSEPLGERTVVAAGGLQPLRRGDGDLMRIPKKPKADGRAKEEARAREERAREEAKAREDARVRAEKAKEDERRAKEEKGREEARAKEAKAREQEAQAREEASEARAKEEAKAKEEKAREEARAREEAKAKERAKPRSPDRGAAAASPTPDRVVDSLPPSTPDAVPAAAPEAEAANGVSPAGSVPAASGTPSPAAAPEPRDALSALEGIGFSDQWSGGGLDPGRRDAVQPKQEGGQGEDDGTQAHAQGFLSDRISSLLENLLEGCAIIPGATGCPVAGSPPPPPSQPSAQLSMPLGLPPGGAGAAQGSLSPAAPPSDHSRQRSGQTPDRWTSGWGGDQSPLQGVGSVGSGLQDKPANGTPRDLGALLQAPPAASGLEELEALGNGDDTPISSAVEESPSSTHWSGGGFGAVTDKPPATTSWSLRPRGQERSHGVSPTSAPAADLLTSTAGIRSIVQEEVSAAVQAACADLRRQLERANDTIGRQQKELQQLHKYKGELDRVSKRVHQLESAMQQQHEWQMQGGVADWDQQFQRSQQYTNGRYPVAPPAPQPAAQRPDGPRPPFLYGGPQPQPPGGFAFTAQARQGRQTLAAERVADGGRRVPVPAT